MFIYKFVSHESGASVAKHSHPSVCARQVKSVVLLTTGIFGLMRRSTNVFRSSSSHSSTSPFSICSASAKVAVKFTQSVRFLASRLPR